MGTFGNYTGPEEIPPEKMEEFSQIVSKILYYGGMMQLSPVKLYGKEITLLDPVRIQTGQDVDFHYNYFEDDFWENAGYVYGEIFYSNKIGWAEFNDVITAVHFLYELYDQGIGFAEIDGDIVSCTGYIGWINHLSGKDFTFEKRFRLWDCAEKVAIERNDYEKPIDIGTLMEILPKDRWQYAGGTELTDLLYIIHGTGSLLGDDIIPGSYPEDVLRCKNAIGKVIQKKGKEDGFQEILKLLKKKAAERKQIDEEDMKELAEISLTLPARVLLYLSAEETEKEFWNIWISEKDLFYRDEKKKKYASDELTAYRKTERSKPVEPISTSIALMQSGGLTFYDTPEELKGEPDYLLSDADRLYWWDGSDEVLIDEEIEKWLKKMGKELDAITEGLQDEYDTQEFVKRVVEELSEVEERYKRVYAFQDMFYEFIANGNRKEYRAAIELLHKLYEEYGETGKVIEKVRSWSTASKNVKCNEGRMFMRRYLSLLANKKLRLKFLKF